MTAPRWCFRTQSAELVFKLDYLIRWNALNESQGTVVTTEEGQSVVHGYNS